MATDTRPEIIRVDSVTKRFGKQVAVDNVSYLLRENEVAGIIGSNGAGKTTFFNLLTGIFPARPRDNPLQRRRRHPLSRPSNGSRAG